jgi:hypothetical protein
VGRIYEYAVTAQWTALYDSALSGLCSSQATAAPGEGFLFSAGKWFYGLDASAESLFTASVGDFLFEETFCPPQETVLRAR